MSDAHAAAARKRWMQQPEEVRRERASLAAKHRWANTSKEDRVANAMKMVRAREKQSVNIS